MMMMMITDLDHDDYLTEENPVIIKLWHIVVGIIGLIATLFVATFVVCGTNTMCRMKIPTLDHLMDSTIIQPFLITCINAVFVLHFLNSSGVYSMVRRKTPRWSKLLSLSTLITYISIAVTMFVFPFTDWDGDYANYLLLLSLAIWMTVVTCCLFVYYKHLVYEKKTLLIWNVVSAFVYTVSSVVYFVLETFFPLEQSGILAVEISLCLGILVFLVVTFVHIWKLEFHVKWRAG